MLHEERQTAHKDLLAPGTDPNSSSRRVGEFIRLHERNAEFHCARDDGLGKRMFRLALGDAGGGYDLLLPEAIG